MLKTQVSLKVAQMKIARHADNLAQACAAKVKPKNDPVQMHLQSQSPQAIANATKLALDSRMGGLGINDPTEEPLVGPLPYEDNMLKDHIWDEEDDSHEDVY